MTAGHKTASVVSPRGILDGHSLPTMAHTSAPADKGAASDSRKQSSNTPTSQMHSWWGTVCQTLVYTLSPADRRAANDSSMQGSITQLSPRGAPGLGTGRRM